MNKGMINNNHSTTVCASQKESINNSIEMRESCLNADSYRQASRIPRHEFFEAALILAMPLNPGFTLDAFFLLSAGIMLKLARNNNPLVNKIVSLGGTC